MLSPIHRDRTDPHHTASSTTRSACYHGTVIYEGFDTQTLTLGSPLSCIPDDADLDYISDRYLPTAEVANPEWSDLFGFDIMPIMPILVSGAHRGHFRPSSSDAQNRHIRQEQLHQLRLSCLKADEQSSQCQK